MTPLLSHERVCISPPTDTHVCEHTPASCARRLRRAVQLTTAQLTTVQLTTVQLERRSVDPFSVETLRAEWRAEAVRRWGSGVPASADVSDWEEWVRSRVGTPPPPSDLQLLQEYYAHDAWQLLVACVLMSRVGCRISPIEVIWTVTRVFD